MEVIGQFYTFAASPPTPPPPPTHPGKEAGTDWIASYVGPSIRYVQ